MARILVVDDERAVRSVLQRMLERDGHEVQLAETGREALKAIAESAVDLVVTDINMPDMDGIELIAAIQDSGRRLPVVAISGGGRIDAGSLLTFAGQLGAVDVLQKPFKIEEIRAVLGRNLPSR